MKYIILISATACMGILFYTTVMAANIVDINTASLAELDSLKNIGPELAQRIVDARPFSSVDDLLKVKGIGTKTLAEIKQQGLASVSSTNQNSVIAPPETNTTNQSSTSISPAINHPTGIIINELLPSPAGSDENGEWIELYNSSAMPINISGWKLHDTQGTITTYAFPENTTIQANGFLVVKRPDTKITLNNEADGVVLLFPDNTTANTASYQKALSGQSYDYSNSSWTWSTKPTPGLPNTIIKAATKAKSLPKAKKTDTTVNVAAAKPPNTPLFTADVSDGATSSNNPWILFFIAVGLIGISGAAALVLKFTVFKNHVRS